MATCRDWWRVDVYAEANKPPTEVFLFFVFLETSLTPSVHSYCHINLPTKAQIFELCLLCNVLNVILVQLFFFLSKMAEIKPINRSNKLVYGPRLETGTRYNILYCLFLYVYNEISASAARCCSSMYCQQMAADSRHLLANRSRSENLCSFDPPSKWDTFCVCNGLVCNKSFLNSSTAKK